MPDHNKIADMLARDTARNLEAQAIQLNEIRLARATQYIKRVLVLEDGQRGTGVALWRHWAIEHWPDRNGTKARDAYWVEFGVGCGLEDARDLCDQRALDRLILHSRARQLASNLAWLSTLNIDTDYEDKCAELERVLAKLEPHGRSVLYPVPARGSGDRQQARRTKLANQLLTAARDLQSAREDIDFVLGAGFFDRADVVAALKGSTALLEDHESDLSGIASKLQDVVDDMSEAAERLSKKAKGEEGQGR